MTFGIDIIVEDPAADLRQEITQIRADLRQDKSGFQRLYDRIKTALKSTSQETIPVPAEAKNQAAQLLDRNPVFLDVETTALYKKDDPRVVEVAVIDAGGAVLFSTLVNPQKPIPAAATAVNGITNQMVADAPLWREISPYLRQVITGRVVVAHNAAFEGRFIPVDWEVELVCSKELANTILGKADWYDVQRNKMLGGSLTARLHQLHLPPGPEHTAAGDCLSALRLVRALAGETDEVELVYPHQEPPMS